MFWALGLDGFGILNSAFIILGRSLGTLKLDFAFGS